MDITDGRIIAKHLHWAATEPDARNNAFNIVNGEVFRWDWMWPKLAEHLDVAAAEYPGYAQPLEQQMAGMEPVWDKIVAKHGLQNNPLNAVASWWHSDADLGRVIENFNDMTKSRDMGFTAYQNSVRSFTDAFDHVPFSQGSSLSRGPGMSETVNSTTVLPQSRNLFPLPRARSFVTVVISTLALILACVLFAPSSVTWGALSGSLPFAAIIAIVGLGQLLVVQQGGFDLSLPGGVSLAVVISTHYPQGDNSLLLTARLDGDRVRDPGRLGERDFWSAFSGSTPSSPPSG